MTLSDALTKIGKQLAPKIDDALAKEVFEEVQDEEGATIYSEVYKVYTPRMYRRRGEYGGLADPYNIKDFYVEGGEYTFHKNWNPLAFVAYIIGTIAGLCNPDWGFLTAMFFGCVSYYLIMRFYGAKKYNQTSMLVNFKS